jgi:DNA end-binding protein Ku
VKRLALEPAKPGHSGATIVNARAIWQGQLSFRKHEIPVKLYAAVVDRQIHFHLLHKRDRTRLQQRMVDSETQEPVTADQTRKAFLAEPGVYVAVTTEEIQRTVPEPSRELRITRFVPAHAIDPELYDRPYYLGPGEESDTEYFALAQAMKKKKAAGLASWVMRKHSYVGALISQSGYLMLITLRHAEEVIPVTELDPPQGRPLDAKEKELAKKLIETLSATFNVEAYHDEYQKRVRELIDAKRAGKKLKPRRAAPRRRQGSLAESLRASLKGAVAAHRSH